MVLVMTCSMYSYCAVVMMIGICKEKAALSFPSYYIDADVTILK